jgi:hypothetical protein
MPVKPKKNKTLAKALTMLDPKLKHILEFGVYTGGSIAFLRKQAEADMKIFGFDSFKGLPEVWVEAEKQVDFSTDGKIPDVPGVTFYKGWFEDTIPKHLKIAEKIGLLHVDCDLYSSTKTVLYSLNKYIVAGTVVVFDEWYFNHKDVPENRVHEQKAFYEWAKDTDRLYEILPEIEDERRIVKILK